MTQFTARDLLESYRKSQKNPHITDAQLDAQARRVELCVKKLSAQHVVILGDPVGTGKTAVALSAAALLKESNTIDYVLISAPNSKIQAQWHTRSKGFPVEGFPIDFCSVSPLQRRNFRSAPFQVRSRGGGAEMPKPIDPDRTLIIIDEAHRGLQIETNEAYRSLQKVANGCRVLYVTATPMQLNVSGLQTMLQAADPSVDLSAVREFHIALQRIVTRDVSDTDSTPDPRMDKLKTNARRTLDRYLLPPFDRQAAGVAEPPRLTKAPVDAQSSWLSAYHIARVVPELVQAGKGDMFQRRLVSSSEAFWGGAAGSALTDLTKPSVKTLVDKLRDELGGGSTHPKVKATTEWVVRRASGDEARKVLVFCVFKETQATLRAMIEKRIPDVRVEAPTTASEFDSSANLFRKDDQEPMVLILTDKFSESVDLDRGRPCLVHHDLSWSPVRLEQRLGRIVRISSGFRPLDRDDIYVPVLQVETDTRLFKTANDRSDLKQRLLAGEALGEIDGLSNEEGSSSKEEVARELL